MNARTLVRLVLAAVAAVIAVALSSFSHGVSLLALPVIGMAALGQDATSDAVRVLASWGILDINGGIKRRIVVKTANYTILSPMVANTAGDPSGTLFTNRGAGGAVTFTLPVITANMAGVEYEFDGVANQTMTIAAAAGTVVTFNNAAAASVAASTAGGKIGAHFHAICDGLSWHVIGDAVGVTYTVA